MWYLKLIVDKYQAIQSGLFENILADILFFIFEMNDWSDSFF